jgi:hypothetical protein
VVAGRHRFTLADGARFVTGDPLDIVGLDPAIDVAPNRFGALAAERRVESIAVVICPSAKRHQAIAASRMTRSLVKSSEASPNGKKIWPTIGWPSTAPCDAGSNQLKYCLERLGVTLRNWCERPP